MLLKPSAPLMWKELANTLPKRCDFRSPLMKTLDWSVKTLGHEYTSKELCIQFYKAE